jgi:putative membrane protein
MTHLKSLPAWISAASVLVAVSAPAVFAEEQAATAPTDADIAHIVVTANTIDVDAGKLAQSKSKNAEVKKFAHTMITDHTGVNKQAAALAKKLGVTPTSNDTSKALMSQAKEEMAKLKTLKGAEFDKEYVSHEVAYHQAVLDTIDKTLVPNAHNEELKGLIVKVRPAIAAHLDHAKMLNSKMQ